MPTVEYVQTWGQTGERFRLVTDGGTRPAMEILVDSDNSIYVAPIVHDNLVPGTCVLQTKGKVHRHDSDQPILAEDGTPAPDFEQIIIKNHVLSPTGVCMSSIYSYVMPRVATLMARCYAPQLPEAELDV